MQATMQATIQATAGTAAEILEEKIKSRTARVGVIGLGYVGLPLAVEFAKAGFAVTGIDVLESKVAQLNRGESYVQDVSTATVRSLVETRKLRVRCLQKAPSKTRIVHRRHRSPAAPLNRK